MSNRALHHTFHSDKNAAGFVNDHRYNGNHGGLDAYFEALQSNQQAAQEEVDEQWVQFEFPKRIEWKPSADTVEEHALAATEEYDVSAVADTLPPRSMTPEEKAVLAHIDAALEKELESRMLLEATGTEIEPRSATPALVERSQTPISIARTATPPVDRQSQSYADHLTKLSAAARYAEIPAVFEAMLATGVQPIADAYNALLMAAVHIPVENNQVVSKALDVYTDMLQRKVSPNSETFNILVSVLSARSLEVAELKSQLQKKRTRFGGMDEPGKFMLASHEFDYAILSEDDRLELAMKLFDTSVERGLSSFSPKTYQQVISACAKSGRVSDMVRLYEHLESNAVVPSAAIFPTMITAFANSGDLISAVECYNEYRHLAVANDQGIESLTDRLDAQVYSAVINAYVISDKIEGAMRFFQKIVKEYGARAVDIKDALVSLGFVNGFLSRGILQEAFYWAQSVEENLRAESMSRIASDAADKDDKVTALEAYDNIPHWAEGLVDSSMAMLAMSVRDGDVAAATKYWHALTSPDVKATAAFIEPTAMYAVALIGSGQVVEGLAQSDLMFQRIQASNADTELAEEIEEGIAFVHQYMETRGIADPREHASPVSSGPQQTVAGSPYVSTPTVSSLESNFDPHAHTTDFKGSALIADDLEGSHSRKGSRLNEALTRFRNMRRSGRHPRYITYAKLISAAAKDGKIQLCHDILAMARTDVPMMHQYSVVRYGWSSILDAMVGACLTLGNRGRAEQFHQELLEMGATPSANTFGLYITTLKDSTKTFDEATEAVRLFHRAKAEGVEPSSFLYNALIGKLGKARRIDDCLFYFTEMRSLGIKPTSVTYGTVVNALCRVSDEKFAEELFDEMESMPNYKARPAPYNSMMQFFLTTQRDKAKVLAYYERMKAMGIAPTAHTYKLLVDTYATLEPVDMTAAEEILNTMRATGQNPEAVHYAALIHARGCVLHDMDGARKVFDSVISDALVPANASLYQALFEAMVANHRVAETEPLLNQMRQSRIALTPYIANTLIHGWAAEKNIEKAQSVYDAVGRDKREPSTYEAMTRAFLAVEQRDKAKAVVGEMLTRGYPSAVVNKTLELLGGAHESAE